MPGWLGPEQSRRHVDDSAKLRNALSNKIRPVVTRFIRVTQRGKLYCPDKPGNDGRGEDMLPLHAAAIGSCGKQTI